MSSSAEDLIDSAVFRRSLEILDDGVTIEVVADGVPYTVEKVDGKLGCIQKEAERPFLIFTATTGAIENLCPASSPEEFGERFAEDYLKKNVDIKIMAPPGTALTYGIFSMLRRMGIRQNMIGGEVKK